MNYGVLIALLILAVGFMFVFSRPTTIDDDNARGRYIVYNRFFDRPAFSGRTFLTKRGAIRAARKLPRLLIAPGMYEVRKVL